MSFVHLHTHSQYSLLESTGRAKDICQKAADYGMPAVALTDNGNMFGAIEFYFAAQYAGIKPIIGLEVYIAPKSRFIKGEDPDVVKAPNRRLVLLAKSNIGYQNLCAISSSGYKEGFYYKPRVDYEILEKHSKDVICLSGGLNGEIPWTFLNKGEEEATLRAKRLAEIFQDNFYLELNRTGRKEWEAINPFLINLSKNESIPLVAANDVHYVRKEEQIAQEVLICIGSNKTLHDETRYKLGSDQFYFKSAEQMKDLFKDIPEACSNTLKIADQCNVEFILKDENGSPIYHLPSYPTKGGVSLKEEIERLSFIGLNKKFDIYKALGDEIGEERKEEYRSRLKFELEVIEGMGFNGYFLIVQDFIQWAKNNDIPVGPGRGSGAGSLVAYSLGITDIDPMPYNLIFERFLNPERVSMPDFDIDFCQENRQRVIEYVTQKYGEQSVSQIITYGKLQARAAIRDVGRVLGMTYGEVDVVAKLVPEKLGINLKEALEEEPRFAELMEADPKVSTLMDLAQKIEGLVRHAGIHAAGVVIADGDLVSHAPLYRGVEGENVVQYDMKHAEKIGLIKFDFLGLKTLTHINYALKHIERNRGKKITTTDISLKDSGVYELISRGDTDGIFQFESDGMKDLLRKAKPSCFEDIVALNALYRPGPMDMIPDYIDRKSGKKAVTFLFDELEGVLRETYGIVVYQEQVQLIAAKIANYSLGEADLLRRAMGKKIAEEMAMQKTRFLKGSSENNFDLKKSEELFDTMAEFAKYGFNKSHAAAYCVIAAQTAFIKHYYPVEFYTALLSTEMSDTDKVVKYVKDAQAHNVEVVSPHINHSDFRFTCHGDTIYFSLGAIKGVGQSAVEAIIEARRDMPEQKFESLEQFFEKVDLRRVNKKTVECLIKSGAFDGFGANRAQLMQGYLKFIERADQIKKDKERGQVSLFSLDEEIAEEEKVKLEECSPWARSARLSYEKEVLGFYLSDHPLKGLENLTSIWHTGSVQELKDKEPKSKVGLIVTISSLREIITKKGTRMAFAVAEDLTGTLELVIFPDSYATTELMLKSDLPLLVSGQLERDGEACKVLVEKIDRVTDLYCKAKKLTIVLDSKLHNKMDKLKELIGNYPGETTVFLRADLPEISKEIGLRVTEPKGLSPSSEFFEDVQRLLGDSSGFSLSN